MKTTDGVAAGPIDPQLDAIERDLRSASERVRSLDQRLSAEQWSTRRDPKRWSPLECVEHLNLTSSAYLPCLEDAISRATPRRGGGRLRRDTLGWLLWRMMKPPVRFRTKTSSPFVPVAGTPAMILERFFDLQDELVTVTGRCEGLRIDRVRIASPFDERVRYDAYSALTILAAHQHRHLDQAEQSA